MDVALRALEAAIELLAVSAPWLLLSLLLAGLLNEFVPVEWVVRNLGGRGLVPITAGVVGGAIMPA